MRTCALLIGTLLIIGICCSVARPPGHVIASENHFENGVRQYEKGHIRQAIHQFEMAIEKNPRNFKAYYYLGLCYKRRGLMDTAHRHFQKAIDLNANDEAWVVKVKAEMGVIDKEKEKKKQ